MNDRLLIVILITQTILFLVLIMLSVFNLYATIKFLSKGREQKNELTEMYKTIFDRGSRSFMPHEARGIARERETRKSIVRD